MQHFPGFLYLPFLSRGQISRVDLATQSFQPISKFSVFSADRDQVKYGLDEIIIFRSFAFFFFFPGIWGKSGEDLPDI